MEKIQKDVLKKLPPLRLYLDELRQLYDFLSKQSDQPLRIATGGYRLTSFEEFPNFLKKRQIQSSL